MFEYKCNFNIIAGSGAIGEICNVLRELNAVHPIIICDKGVFDIGLINKLTDPLEKGGVKYAIYNGVLPEPTAGKVAEAADAVRDEDADCIIAFGGGATIDTAKGASILLHNDCVLWEVNGAGLIPGLPIIAVPTTSGTGSDQSVGGMISEDETHIKHGIYSEIPAASICDPEITRDLPKGPTVNGAADAFTHAFEVYTSCRANLYTDIFAEKAMETVCEYLPRVLTDKHDMDARERLMVTASYSGMLIAQTGLHVSHAIGHALGGRFGIVHGQSVAVTLPEVMRLYADTMPEKMTKVAGIIGAAIPADADDAQLGAALKKRMTELLRTWGVPNLTAAGLRKENVNSELLDEISADGLFYCGERDMEEDDVQTILDWAFDF